MATAQAAFVGTLHGTDDRRIFFMRPDGDPGDYHEYDPGCVVTLDGVEATLADLRRGDRVTIEGSPVEVVVATRPKDQANGQNAARRKG